MQRSNGSLKCGADRAHHRDPAAPFLAMLWPRIALFAEKAFALLVGASRKA
jgi:hypothetical protein